MVVRSIPTLRSIRVAGRRGKDSGRVAAIIAELVPSSAKLINGRVAPKLTRVELVHGANAVVKAGKASAIIVLSDFSCLSFFLYLIADE